MTAGTEKANEKRTGARRPVFTRRRVCVAVGLLLLFAAAAIAIVWWRQPYTTRAMRLLAGACKDQRPVLGRLVGGFKGASFAPPAEADALLQSPDVIAASRLVDKAVEANEPGARLVYARLLLLTGDKGARTLKAFRRAVAAEPESAAATNDLGVCLLARDELEKALEMFDAALQQQPEMAEALFNRALCYQQLELRDAASEDFARLLAIERDSSWHDEIRSRHEATSADISPKKRFAEAAAAFDQAFNAQNFDEARRIADEDLVLIFGHAYSDCFLAFLKAAAKAESEVSERELGKVKLIGERLAAACGDKSFLDLTAYAQSLSRDGAASELALIEQFNEIDDHPYTRPATERRNTLAKLRWQFAERGNRYLEFHVLYETSNFDYYQGAYSEARPNMEEALAIATSREWSYQRAFALIQLGSIYARIGRDSQTLTQCQQAIREVDMIPKVRANAVQIMANACWHLGKIQQGLLYLRESSKIFSTAIPNPTVVASNAVQMADFYQLINNHKLALLYARQALHDAGTAASNRYVAQATAIIAIELARQEQFGESEAELQRAFAAVEKMQKSKGDYTECLVLTRAGDIATLRGNYQQAEAYYTRAQANAENSEEKTLRLVNVLKAQAESYVRAGRPVAARQDLERAIPLVEKYRSQITRSDDRSDFFGIRQDVFDQMIQLQARQFGQWADAFNTAEQARARTLLPEIYVAAGRAAAQGQTTAVPPTANALTLDRIRAALPDNLTLISYSVSSNGTLIFVVSRKTFEVAESQATTDQLDEMVQDYLAGMQERAPVEELAEQARKLYDLLIAPVESKLGATRYLCIAPDKALHRLPFSALVDRKGSYFGRSYVLTGAPSASTLAYCLDQARAKGAAPAESMLAVGNPLFSRDHFPALLPLPEAEHEASESASLYAQSVILKGPDATKARLLTELKQCDVAHFSAHCLVEEKTPWLAALVLTQISANKEDELLRLNEVEKIGLLRARLVILSACQSGLGQYYRGEGIVSLVRPFLAQGVPTVVASLWSVDSQATATLMIDFHRARRRNSPDNTADALHNAQLQMMQSTSFSHPYYWAPFVVIGSGN